MNPLEEIHAQLGHSPEMLMVTEAVMSILDEKSGSIGIGTKPAESPEYKELRREYEALKIAFIQRELLAITNNDLARKNEALSSENHKLSVELQACRTKLKFYRRKER